MAKLNLIETIQTKLPTLTKKDGQLIVVRDNASLHIDLDGSRIYISDWIDISTDEERLAMLSPLNNKYYYVVETNKIWRYTSGSWVLISSIKDINEHIEDTDIHVTTTDKTNWNVAHTHSQSEHAPSDAEKNQNAFSNVKVDSTTITADTTTDTLTLVAGNNVTITPDATNDKITISAQDTTYSAFVKSGSGAKAGLVPTPSTTAGTTKYLREDGTWQIPAGTGVRNISTGTTNGTINVNLNGMDFEVAVKGLGSAAYTNSGAYAAASHGTHVTYGTSANALGTSSAGSATTVSRSDHVHALPALTSCTGTLTIDKGGTGATTASGALTNLGITATATELNVLDGMVSSTTELNYCNGLTSNIQTQLNNIATSIENEQINAPLRNIKNYGADGSGSNDSYNALMECYNECVTNGGIMYIPKGIYIVSQPLNFTNSIRIIGDGAYNTILRPTFTSDIFLTLSGGYSGVENLQIFAGSMTNSIALQLEGVGTYCDKIIVEQPYLGIKITGVWSKILNTKIQGGDNFWMGIRVEGGDCSQIISNVLVTSNHTKISDTCGISIDDSSALTIDNSSFMWCEKGMYISSDIGTVFSLTCDSCFFDNCTNNLYSSANASVKRAHFNNCWFGSGTQYGVRLEKGFAGSFNQCYITLNNIGVNCSVSNAIFNNCNFSGNGRAVMVYNNSNIMKFIGCNFIDIYGEGVNEYAFAFDTVNNTSNITISNCDMSNQSISTFLNKPTGSNLKLFNNIGA